jgi:hypothetical protein
LSRPQLHARDGGRRFVVGVLVVKPKLVELLGQVAITDMQDARLSPRKRLKHVGQSDA